MNKFLCNIYNLNTTYLVYQESLFDSSYVLPNLYHVYRIIFESNDNFKRVFKIVVVP